MSGKVTKIVFCNCAYSQVISDDVKAGVLKAIRESGVQVDVVQDLCELAASAQQLPVLQEWANAKELKPRGYPDS